MTMISRVGFCAECAKLRRPKTGQLFCVIGATNTYHLYYANHNGELGFTPHIYNLIKVIGTNVIYKKLCTMEECGLTIDHTTGEFYFDKYKWERGMMTIEQWNALQKFRDTGYTI